MSTFAVTDCSNVVKNESELPFLCPVCFSLPVFLGCFSPEESRIYRQCDSRFPSSGAGAIELRIYCQHAWTNWLHSASWMLLAKHFTPFKVT